MPVPPARAKPPGGDGASTKVLAVPWSERHRPRHLGEVIGNTDQVRKLAEWLRDWDEVVLHGKVKETPVPADTSRSKFAPPPENLNARAALISGPPGIGKTTTCTLVARCNPKYRLMEFNASDARGKAVIESMSSSLAGNHTLRLGGDGKSAIERAVIIMDECDGMSAGLEAAQASGSVSAVASAVAKPEGGMSALMSMIKNTKNPIICICNDRNDMAVRNLASICLDIKFKRPENAAVAKRIKHVLEGEGKRVDQSTIEAVVEACGHDIRHVINQAQFFGTVAPHGRESQKDTQVMLSPFDACERLLRDKHAKLAPMERRMDMFFLDADLMPLMIQENYLRPYERRRRRDGDELAECAAAAELIALGDTMWGNWEVGSSAAIIGAIYPAFVTADESFARPSFPNYLQRRQPMAKAQRLVQEMYSRVRGVTSTSVREVVTSNYHDIIYKRLLKPLQFGAAKECASALFGSGLTREFFTEQAPAMRQPLQLDNGYTKVEGKVKTQLAQELQALQQQHQTAQPVKRKREDVVGSAFGKRRRAGGEAAGSGLGMDEPEPTQGEGDEGGDGGVGAASKKRKAAKGSKAAAAGAGSLATWRPKKIAVAVDDVGGADGREAKGGDNKPLMIMKYLDGHTCAVRRKVHMRDILEPWVLF